MARPPNTARKQQIREARAAGASVAALMADFGLSRNTIFFHLREDTAIDGRVQYDAAEKARLADMGPAALAEEARRLGKTAAAVQRAAYRARKALDEEAAADFRTKLTVRGYLNFALESELRLFGLSRDQVSLANRRLAPYKVGLKAPNRLVDPTGRYCVLSLAFQKAILTDTIATLVAAAPRIKTLWRLPTCPACGQQMTGMIERTDGTMSRVCSCGGEEIWRQGYRSER